MTAQFTQIANLLEKVRLNGGVHSKRNCKESCGIAATIAIYNCFFVYLEFGFFF